MSDIEGKAAREAASGVWETSEFQTPPGPLFRVNTRGLLCRWATRSSGRFLQQIMSELRSEKSSAGSTLKIFFAP